MALVYSDSPQSFGFVDADHGGDKDSGRSTTGYLFQVFGCTIA